MVTQRILGSIAGYPTVDAILAAAPAREIRAVRPRILQREGEERILLPDGNGRATDRSHPRKMPGPGRPGPGRGSHRMAGVNDVLTIVLGGGRGSRLFPLTHHRSKPAVPIGGKYRLIDIALSNCLHADLDKVYYKNLERITGKKFV